MVFACNLHTPSVHLKSSLYSCIVKDESEKRGLKFNIPEMKIMAASPITSWQIDGENNGKSGSLFSWAPKSLQMVPAAMK